MKYRSKEEVEQAILNKISRGVIEDPESAIAYPHYSEEPNEDGSYDILYWYIFYLD